MTGSVLHCLQSIQKACLCLVVSLSLIFQTACKEKTEITGTNRPLEKRRSLNTGSVQPPKVEFSLTNEALEGVPFVNVSLPLLPLKDQNVYNLEICAAGGSSCVSVKSYGGELSLPSETGAGIVRIKICSLNNMSHCAYVGEQEYILQDPVQIPTDYLNTINHLFKINYKLRDLLFYESLFLYEQNKLCNSFHSQENSGPEVFFRAMLTEPIDKLIRLILDMGGEDLNFDAYQLPVQPDNYRAIVLPDGQILSNADELFSNGLQLAATGAGNDGSKESDETDENSKSDDKKDQIEKDLEATWALGSLGVGLMFSFVYASYQLNQMGAWNKWVEGQKSVLIDTKGNIMPPGTRQENGVRRVELEQVPGRKNVFAYKPEGEKEITYLRDINKKMIPTPLTDPNIQMKSSGEIHRTLSNGTVEKFYPERVNTVGGVLGHVDIKGGTVVKSDLSGYETRMRTAIERHKFDPRLDSHIGAKYGNKARKAYIITSATLATLNAALLLYALNNHLTGEDPDRQFFEMTLAMSAINGAYHIVDVWDALRTKADWTNIKSSTHDLGLSRRMLEKSDVRVRRSIETTRYATDTELKAGKGIGDDLSYKFGEVKSSMIAGGKGRIMVGGAVIVASMVGVITSFNELQKFDLTENSDDPSFACQSKSEKVMLAHMINIRNLRLELITNTTKIMNTLGDF